MPRQAKDYDSVFKVMKVRHQRLFISLINEAFGKNYPLDVQVEVLPSDGALMHEKPTDGSKKIEQKEADFILKIGSEKYLVECQSYDDDSMAIRIAEYAFIIARDSATWDAGHAVIPMPHFVIVYVKSTEKTPKKTTITFTFPDGQTVNYESDNIILKDYTREEIVEKRLFPLIPFYITRYEKQLIVKENKDTNIHTAEEDILNQKQLSIKEMKDTNIHTETIDARNEKQIAAKEKADSNIEAAINDLEYFKNEMIRLHEAGELSDNEWVDLKGFVNNIITHITDGNKNEERLVAVMGGELFETESERLMRIGREEGIAFGRKEGIAFGREEGMAFGREQGRETANALTVRNLLKRDTPDADIMEIVGCDQNFIDKVRSGQLQPV
jgi:hypothetical protein